VEYDTRIAGGQVMVSGQLVPLDVLISGETVAALVERSDLSSARKTIDASGRLVLPGGIDTHTHVRTPGYTHKEDFFTASCAAAAGGVTTIIDMPNVEPPTDTLETFLEKREIAARDSIVDWGHWVAGTKVEEIKRMADAGATGYKIFQISGGYPHDDRLSIGEAGPLLASFRAIAETGLPCLVHPFNMSLFNRLSEEAFAAGKPTDGVTFSEVYTTEANWHTGVYVCLALQRLSGVRLHLLHTHASESLRLIRQARANGQPVTCEIDPKYYHLTPDDLERLGPRAVPAGFVTPDEPRMAEIWASLRDGTISNIGTDHAPHTREEVDVALTEAWKAQLGSPQLDTLWGLILTDVAQGHHSLTRAVELLCEGPSKVAGIWPKKGVILPGSDADLILVDPDREWIVDDAKLYTKVKWSPYVGRTFRGAVTMTMLRGTVIAENGEVVGARGYGKYIAGSPGNAVLP
jgi:dihydroorotase